MDYRVYGRVLELVRVRAKRCHANIYKFFGMGLYRGAGPVVHHNNELIHNIST
jgi:hypothetical protein